MAKKEKTPNRKPSWAKIKAEYITGEMSCRNLAKKYDISESSMLRHCTNEDWVKAREEYQINVTSEAIAHARTRAIKDRTELLLAAETLAGTLLKAIADPQELHKYITLNEQGDPIVKVVDKIDSKSAKNFASALKDLYPVITALKDSKGGQTVNIIFSSEAEDYAV